MKAGGNAGRLYIETDHLMLTTLATLSCKVVSLRLPCGSYGAVSDTTFEGSI